MASSITDADYQLMDLFDDRQITLPKINTLLAAGAKVDGAPGLKDPTGRQFHPIERAIAYGMVPVIELLLNYGASPEIEEGLSSVRTSILHGAAASDRDNKIVRVLLKYPRVREYMNRPMGSAEDTPLHRAVATPYISPGLVWELMKAGAEPTIPNRRGMTALDIAEAIVAEAHPPRHAAEKLRMVKYPLHYAVEEGNLESVRHFMRASMDAMSTDDTGRTAVDIAIEKANVPHPTDKSLRILAMMIASGKITHLATSTGGQQRRHTRKQRTRSRKNSRKH